MQDRPHAHELAAALAQYLEEDLLPTVSREQRFGVLVAANAAAVLAREAAAADDAAAVAPLRGFVGDAPDDPRAVQEALARAIRSGALDDRHDELVAALRTFVAAKLAVAHPGYDSVTDDGRG